MDVVRDLHPAHLAEMEVELDFGELGIRFEQYREDGPVPMDIEQRRVRFAS